MDKRKKYILLIDTETTGGLDNPLCYDISFMVIDKKGNVYEQYAYVVEEIFNNQALMQGAYYNNKLPKYYAELEKGTYKMDTLLGIAAKMKQLVLQYNINTITAYNAEFDLKAINNTKEFLKIKGNILPSKKYHVWCIWAMACQLIYTQKTYRKVAVEQGWVSEKGNIKTNAEVGYRYITGEYDFEEEHLGLYDIMIEKEILAKCLRQNKKHTKTIDKQCWKIPQTLKRA